MNKRLEKRYRFERIFRGCCLFSMFLVVSILLILITSLSIKAYGTLYQAKISVNLDCSKFSKDDIYSIDQHIKVSLLEEFKNDKNINIKSLYKMISLDSARNFQKKYRSQTGKISVWIDGSSIVGTYLKDKSKIEDDSYSYILNKWKTENKIKLKFSMSVFFNSDSREPESAGFLGGIIGSILTITICVICAVPIGVFSAVFLEEYVPKSKFKHFIELNINNLAAVPSIVYGLLGLAVLIDTLHMPRSSSLVGGLVLAILTMPTIIVATRQSIKSIPISIKHGVLALGASPMQVTMHHILPLSIPGIITGAILSVSRAIGETAPLIMLGMVAFIADVPTNFLDPAASMPVLIYSWADSPEYGFVEKTSAAIMILIFLIVGLNYYAISIRNKYEHRF